MACLQFVQRTQTDGCENSLCGTEGFGLSLCLSGNRASRELQTRNKNDCERENCDTEQLHTPNYN